MDTRMYKGYEIREHLSRTAKRVIKRLSKRGYAVYQHDDEPYGVSVVAELRDFAAMTGMWQCPEEHRLVLVDLSKTKVVHTKKPTTLRTDR